MSPSAAKLRLFMDLKHLNLFSLCTFETCIIYLLYGLQPVSWQLLCGFIYTMDHFWDHVFFVSCDLIITGGAVIVCVYILLMMIWGKSGSLYLEVLKVPENAKADDCFRCSC